VYNDFNHLNYIYSLLFFFFFIDHCDIQYKVICRHAHSIFMYDALIQILFFVTFKYTTIFSNLRFLYHLDGPVTIQIVTSSPISFLIIKQYFCSKF